MRKQIASDVPGIVGLIDVIIITVRLNGIFTHYTSFSWDAQKET